MIDNERTQPNDEVVKRRRDEIERNHHDYGKTIKLRYCALKHYYNGLTWITIGYHTFWDRTALENVRI